MKEWPLNNVTMSAVTHSKLRKALDGTGTQVATCMINRWTIKMNGVEGYITIETSQRGGRPVTPEQCHLICCNSQQVEESAGWDRYSSSDLYDQQMDGQDEME